MNQTEMFEMYSRLLHSGWKEWEAASLYEYLLRYKQTSLDLPDLSFDMRKLKFLRYLVQTGRLSEEDMLAPPMLCERMSAPQAAHTIQ